MRAVTLIPQWKSVTLGGRKDGGEYRRALDEAGIRLDGRAAHFLDSGALACAAERVNADLVLASAADLGFSKAATYRQISARAYENGLDLCPDEVGPALRLACCDQPVGERLILGMQPIEDSDGGSMLFCLERADEGLLLKVLNGPPGRFWCPMTRFVFLIGA